VLREIDGVNKRKSYPGSKSEFVPLKLNELGTSVATKKGESRRALAYLAKTELGGET